jgi:hypothetical protein
MDILFQTVFVNLVQSMPVYLHSDNKQKIPRKFWNLEAKSSFDHV